MSYCRWGCDGSDVYVYATGPDHDVRWVCCGCSMTDPEDSDSVCASEEGMINHLLAHRAAGDTVPEYAIERLRKESK